MVFGETGARRKRLAGRHVQEGYDSPTLFCFSFIFFLWASGGGLRRSPAGLQSMYGEMVMAIEGAKSRREATGRFSFSAHAALNWLVGVEATPGRRRRPGNG